MAFKTYVKLTLPISIQQATEFGTTEQAILEALSTIWKSLAEFDTVTFSYRGTLGLNIQFTLLKMEIRANHLRRKQSTTST